MSDSMIIRKNIITNAINQTKSAKNEAIRVHKEELKESVAMPKIAELRANCEQVIVELKAKLEKDIQAQLDLADFRAVSEVNAIYDEQISKLEALLPQDANEEA